MTTQFIETTAGQSKEMPARTIIYGVPKIGKSRFAAQYPEPFFIDIEGGLSYLDKQVRATPKLNTYDEVVGWLKHIYESDTFTAGTIALDSADWLETLAQQRLIKLYNAKSINDPQVKEFAYFKGVLMAADDAIKVLGWLDAIHNKKGIKCILIAHSEIKTIEPPNKDPYQRNQMKCSKYFSNKLCEWADIVLFADYAFHVTKDGKTSEPKPVLCAGGSASFVGGGRMRLSKELPIDYKQLEKEIMK